MSTLTQVCDEKLQNDRHHLVQVPSTNMEEVGFMTSTAAGGNPDDLASLLWKCHLIQRFIQSTILFSSVLTGQDT